MDILEQLKQNRRKFRVDHFDILVKDYVNRFNEGKIILNPPYQRVFRWDMRNQSQLIESVLIGLPLPPIFVFSNEDALWEIVDGVQRTNTFCNFLNNYDTYTFCGCEILTELNGKTLKSLPDYVKNSLENVRIRIEIIEDTADIESQYILFNRLNSNGLDLSPQEMRNFLIYKVNSNFYKKISELKNLHSFKLSINLKEEHIDKQEDIEYIIRFFLSRKFAIDSNNRNYDTIPDLIDNEIKEYLKTYDNSYLEKEYSLFEKTFNYIYELLGDNSFRYFIKKSNSIVNTYSITCGISFFINECIKNYSHDEMKKIMKNYYESNEYKNITKQSYSPTKRMIDISKFSYAYFKEKLGK